MSGILNIAYCFDENYEQHAAASAMSVISNFGANPSRLAFHFLTDTARPRMVAYAADLERLFGCSATVLEAGKHEHALRARIPNTVFQDKYWSIAALYRLALPAILSPSITRLLYLDCDTILLDDVSHLFEFELGGHAAGAVIDPAEATDKVALGTSRYFNSGVLLMQLDAWREQMIGELCVNYLSQPLNPMKYIDQDAINKVLDGKIAQIPDRWNFQIANRLTTPNAFASARQHASALHFVTKNKPWHAWYYNSVGEYYWAYLRASPWKNPRLQEPKVTWQWHQMAIAAVRQGRLKDAVDHYERLVQHYIQIGK